MIHMFVSVLIDCTAMIIVVLCCLNLFTNVVTLIILPGEYEHV